MVIYSLLISSAVFSLSVSLSLSIWISYICFYICQHAHEFHIPRLDKVDTINDAEEWRAMIDGLLVVGFDQNEQEDMLQLVAAVLHIGNLHLEVCVYVCYCSLFKKHI